MNPQDRFTSGDRITLLAQTLDSDSEIHGIARLGPTRAELDTKASDLQRVQSGQFSGSRSKDLGVQRRAMHFPDTFQG